MNLASLHSGGFIKPVAHACLTSSCVCCSVRNYAGEALRLSRGQERSGNENGPLTDEPDWEYAADGTQPGPSRAQQRRIRAAAKEEARLLKLFAEMNELRSDQDVLPVQELSDDLLLEEDTDART